MNRNHLTLLVALLLVLGFSATSTITYRNASRSFQQELREDILPLASDAVSSLVQQDITRLSQVSSLMAEDQFFSDWIRGGEQSSEDLQRYLDGFCPRETPGTSFLASKGTRQYYVNDSEIPPLSLTVEEYSRFFEPLPTKPPKLVFIGPDQAYSNTLTIFIGHPVHAREKAIIGVAGCALPVTSILQPLAQYTKNLDRNIYFVDRHGQVVLSLGKDHPSPGELQSIRTLYSPPNQAPGQSISFSYERNHEQYLATMQPLPSLNWLVFVEQATSTYAHAIQNTLLLNFAVSLLIGFLIVGTYSYTISKYQKKLSSTASTDTLTQFINRHAFEPLFHQAIHDAHDTQKPLTIVLFDVDHFKDINDQYGHLAGDAVLMSIAESIQRAVRSTDYLCRWGGEEFLLLLKNCPFSSGQKIAEKIRTEIDQVIIYYESSPIHVQVSAGIVELQEGEDAEWLLQRVDQALYQAKNSGRNRIETI